jgi:hypothetical protein
MIKIVLKEAMKNTAKASLDNSPLNPTELRDVGRANMFLMDADADGWFHKVPQEIQKLSALNGRLQPSQQRLLLRWFYSTAPGDY